MGIEINFSAFNDIEHNLNSFDNFASNGLEEKIGSDIANSITDRVQNYGIGSEGKKLKNKRNEVYSPSYKKKRAKLGYTTSQRELTRKGTMFSSLTTIKRLGHTIVTFIGENEKNKALGNERNSPFFSIGILENKEIDRAIQKAVDMI
jgi:hypothetical protein